VAGRSVEEILEELLAWTKFANIATLVATLTRVLDDEVAFRIYEASDGTQSQDQIATAVGVSQPTVSRAHARWRRMSLVREVNGKTIHLLKPSDLGLKTPQRPGIPAKEQ
jgi:hypothetical protein